MRRADAAELIELTDPASQKNAFADEALASLSSIPRSLPSKYFYDARGSELFEAISRLEEYYLTRTELAIMEEHALEMARRLGPECLLIEYGSGSSLKTRILLNRLERPVAYVPIDISRDHLLASAEELQLEFPSIQIIPVWADYTVDIEVPEPIRTAKRVGVYFPGSTIGNFPRNDAIRFLRKLRTLAQENGAVLIGVDTEKDVSIMLAAYNDAQGITEEFNKNLLRRLNRELDTDFDLDAFRHEAVYNAAEARIEMYLISLRDQSVTFRNDSVPFRRGERIRTEYSHKYSIDRFAEMVDRAGLRIEHRWTDAKEYFSVYYLTVAR